MASKIHYKMDLAGVNWEAMKEAVAADDFDNGRTPEQLRRSFENSAVTCIAYAGGELTGTVRALADGVCNAYSATPISSMCGPSRPFAARGSPTA
jgi:hypothetical protein